MHSPHPWGWTDLGFVKHSLRPAFPTPVGMDRRFVFAPEDVIGIPHTRGDGPAGLRCHGGRVSGKEPRVRPEWIDEFFSENPNFCASNYSKTRSRKSDIKVL